MALVRRVPPDQLLLNGGQRISHEGHHLVAAILVKHHAIEESFDDDKRLVRGLLNRPVEVEDLLPFLESWRQLVFRGVVVRFAGHTAGVGDDVPICILDGDGDPLGHHALGAVPDAEFHDGFDRKAALREIRMVSFQLVQPELEGRVGRDFLRGRCGFLRCGLRLRSCFALGNIRLALFLGIGRHGLRVEIEPFDGLDGGAVNAHVFHPRNEIENVAAAFALAETIPDILAQAHPKLGRVLAFVDRTGTAQAVAASFESVEDVIMNEYLLHGQGCFDGPEVDKHLFGHTTPLFELGGTRAAQDIEPIPGRILVPSGKPTRRADLPLRARRK